MRLLAPTAGLLLLFAPLAASADEAKAPDDGFVPMFNGKDLSGWVNVNCAPDTFTVKDGEIITTGKPTGYLRTDRQYENFVAEFDWMHVPPQPGAVGNSGFFVWADPIPAVGTGYTRGIEVQVLVNLTYKNKKGEITATSQGDLFSIWGAHCVPDRPHPDGWERCLPSADYCKGENEWNHYRVEANDGRITLAVNGHVVSGLSKCNPRKGCLALESEGSECHFKNLKIKELPSTNPKPAEIAYADQGFKSLYTGLDLSGWTTDDEAKKHWQPKDTLLHYDGRGPELRTAKEFVDAEFVLDFRLPSKDATQWGFFFDIGDDKGRGYDMGPDGKAFAVAAYKDGRSRDLSGRQLEGMKPNGQWNRLRIARKGDIVELQLNDGAVFRSLGGSDKRGKSAFVLRPQGEMDFANLFVRELK